jgi:hypothetical protein
MLNIFNTVYCITIFISEAGVFRIKYPAVYDNRFQHTASGILPLEISLCISYILPHAQSQVCKLSIAFWAGLSLSENLKELLFSAKYNFTSDHMG